VQILTPVGVLDRAKQRGVVREITDIVAAAAGDPSLPERTWVLITESPKGGWGIAGIANTGADFAAAARAELTAKKGGNRMKAIGLTEFGGPEVLKVVDLPEPEPGSGEVRIRVYAVAVNPTDITFRTGGRAAQLAARPTPYVPGMDVAGVVDKLGEGTDGRLAVGDRVIAYVIPFGPHGGSYAEKIVVPEPSVVPAPRGASLADASTLLLNATTARLSLDALGLAPGTTIAIVRGTGVVGGYAIQLAKADGLRVLTDAAPGDEELVRSLGADVVVERAREVASQIRRELPDGVIGLIDSAALDAGTSRRRRRRRARDVERMDWS
jgi:NADPH:quinone reductase